MKFLLKLTTTFYILLGFLLIILPLTYILLPKLYREQAISLAQNPETETKILEKALFEKETTPLKVQETPQMLIPENEAVTYGNTITIPSIGVDTSIYESLSGKLGLDKGVWRDPNHSTPEAKEKNGPVVIAAHRWGPNDATWEYRNKHLFVGFDRLKTGDEVFIKWNGKEYKYRISFLETNNQASRLDDLIMYTCVDYTSDQRIFVYATLVN
jgi:LPXTG-site transpeptidase (sortase) family protein